ncbi:hypothetical protein CG736_00370 [Kitasatospora sp. CB02891]|nr:hypothetical protein CG736_00370 [Kitasatospora sp. CB02891]
MGAWSWASVIGFVVTFDGPFTVEGPPELVDAAREVSGRLDTGAPLLRRRSLRLSTGEAVGAGSEVTAHDALAGGGL